MSVSFILTSKTRVDSFKDTLSIDDVENYSFDCSPWVEDNEAITAVTWTLEGGNVSITNQSLSGSNVSANIGASQAGTALVSILLQTASSIQKKLWLSLRIKDKYRQDDDYGICEG